MKYSLINATLTLLILSIIAAAQPAYGLPVDEIIWEQDDNFIGHKRRARMFLKWIQGPH